jgi:hypothetical protein
MREAGGVSFVSRNRFIIRPEPLRHGDKPRATSPYRGGKSACRKVVYHIMRRAGVVAPYVKAMQQRPSPVN